jgi:putative polymerase
MALILGAGICAILSDSRFAFACWILMLLLRSTPLYRSRFVLFCVPLGMMLTLLIVGSLNQLPIRPYIMSDDFPGRLLFSGRLLNYWGWPQWLGFSPSPVYTADTGYAYVINNLGLPLALGLFGLFAAKIPASPEAASMKAMITVYMATSLCIGANMFTIKTAALIWFLYGAVDIISPVPKSFVAKSAGDPAAFGAPVPLGGGGEPACQGTKPS